MQAYYEIETDIPLNHQLNIRLPDNIPAGRAKVAVNYEVNESSEQTTKMADFLNSLPDNTSDGLSRSDIENHINQERKNWDD